jgi:hypothetical protein
VARVELGVSLTLCIEIEFGSEASFRFVVSADMSDCSESLCSCLIRIFSARELAAAEAAGESEEAVMEYPG